MKAVLISIKPKYVELIASGEKTIEVRKTRPKIETPFKCYIYATKSGDRIVLKNDRVWEISKELTGKVMGEFVCDRVNKVGWISSPDKSSWIDRYDKETCLTARETYEYAKGGIFYEWHISDLVIYDKPKELSEFTPICKYKDERCWNCVCYEEAFGGCCRVLSRPPQSWCYVKEN